MTTAHEAAVRAVAAALGRYEFPARTHGDRLSLKLTTEDATAIAIAALATDADVRAGLYIAAERLCIAAGVAKETDRPFSHIVVDAILAALAPEPT